MNHNEIEAALIRAKRGDSDATLSLIEQFKPFIFKTAKGLHIKNMDNFDLLQIGYTALLQAMEKYKIGSHTFSSYAYNSIKNNLNYALRGTRKYKEEVSLNTPLQEGSGAELLDLMEGEDVLEADFLRSENIKEVKKAIASLGEEELEFVIFVYYNEIPLKTYAAKKGISYLSAVRRKNKILKLLKNELEKSHSA